MSFEVVVVVVGSLAQEEEEWRSIPNNSLLDRSDRHCVHFLSLFVVTILVYIYIYILE